MEILNDFYGVIPTKVSIYFIGETLKPNEEKTFIKRDVCLQIEEEINGNPNIRYMTLQCTGATDKPTFDKTKLLDEFKVGDFVDVKFSINGSTSKNEKLTPTENNPGCLNGFNNLSVNRISLYNPNQQGGYQPQPNIQTQSKPQVNNPQTGGTTNVNTSAQNSAPKFTRPTGAAPLDAEQKEMVWNENTGQWESLPF